METTGIERSKVPNYIRENQICDHVRTIHKYMKPDKTHSGVLSELAYVVAKALSVISEKPWKTDEVPGDWRKQNISHIFRNG